MFQLKTPRIPKNSSNQPAPEKKIPLKLPSSGVKMPMRKLLPISGQPSGGSGSQAQKRAATTPGGSSAGNNASDTSKLPFTINGSAKDELFSVLFETYKAAQVGKTDKPASSRVAVPAKPQAAQSIIKPVEQGLLKDLLLLVDGGKNGNYSGGYTNNTKTGSVVPITKSGTVLPPLLPPKMPATPASPIPKEYADVAALVAKLPEGFDLSGWDDKPAVQQERQLRNSGLTKQEQFRLLNSSTSLETLAVIQDIQQNRLSYGLSVSEVKDTANQLLQISNARIGAKNHAMPFSENAGANKTFLKMLDEKENDLLTAIGFGISFNQMDTNDVADAREQMIDLISGDSSISSVLQKNEDPLNAGEDFFSDMDKLESVISDVENGKIAFNSAAEKKRYLDYLTSEYNKNDALYRRRLAEVVDDARLQQFPDSRFKSLINELSLSQLEVLAEQMDEQGVRKLSRTGNFEKLMRNLLSDQESALNITADETVSPIRPYVWNGMDIVDDKGIKLSGYYFKDNQYYFSASCGKEEYQVPIGNNLPFETAIEVNKVTDWDIQGQQAALFATKLSNIIDVAYNLGLLFGMPPLLPINLAPSDIPKFNDLLDRIDPQKDIPRLADETITLKIVSRKLNSSETELQIVHFLTE